MLDVCQMGSNTQKFWYCFSPFSQIKILLLMQTKVIPKWSPVVIQQIMNYTIVERREL